MAQANLSGMAGVAVGGACGWAVGHALGAIGQSPFESVAWGSLAGCFAASMFGLLYDRSAVPEFRKSYGTLMNHFIGHDCGGADWDPRERLAVFVFPLAGATVVIPVLAVLYLIAASYDHSYGFSFAAIYFAASLAAAAATFIIGNATVEHRLLQREVAFNTTPLSQEQQKKVVPAKRIVGPPTEADLARLRTRGRRDAVLAIMLGLLCLVLNHWEVMNEQRMYLKLIYGGPMIVMMGVFGIFQPLIMTRHLPVGKYYPKTILLLTLLAIAAGAVGGMQIEAYYRG